jgi:hypothetical protein
MKRTKKLVKISDDPRWEDYNLLKKQNKLLEAKKLKGIILDSYKWKKACHHM